MSLELFKNFDKIINNFFKLFYNKEDTILLYGNYSGINHNLKNLKSNLEEEDNLKQINLIQNNVKDMPEDEEDIDISSLLLLFISFLFNDFSSVLMLLLF